MDKNLITRLQKVLDYNFSKDILTMRMTEALELPDHLKEKVIQKLIAESPTMKENCLAIYSKYLTEFDVKLLLPLLENKETNDRFAEVQLRIQKSNQKFMTELVHMVVMEAMEAATGSI